MDMSVEGSGLAMKDDVEVNGVILVDEDMEDFSLGCACDFATVESRFE